MFSGAACGAGWGLGRGPALAWRGARQGQLYKCRRGDRGGWLLRSGAWKFGAAKPPVTFLCSLCIKWEGTCHTNSVGCTALEHWH